MKTNKSYTKRLKVTKKGKILGRIPGQNHFNAKSSRRKQLNHKGTAEFTMTNKQISRFLPNA
ncbi:MAG: 50S ribosomal protein L35 [Candidatus Vogelbacteria bacterium]|nr:50S ribosomal protein L35 [Candidatus Vogelbacteria bacterium]